MRFAKSNLTSSAEPLVCVNHRPSYQNVQCRNWDSSNHRTISLTANQRSMLGKLIQCDAVEVEIAVKLCRVMNGKWE